MTGEGRIAGRGSARGGWRAAGGFLLWLAAPLLILTAPVAWAGGLDAADDWAVLPQSQGDSVAGAEALIAAGDLEGAAGMLDELVARDRRNFEAWTLLGVVHRRLGNFDRARTYHQRALDIEPGHRQTHLNFGELWLESGYPGRAREHLGQLEMICSGECPEYRALRDAIGPAEKSRRK